MSVKNRELTRDREKRTAIFGAKGRTNSDYRIERAMLAFLQLVFQIDSKIGYF